jgi:hypothetical protein
MNRKFKYTNPVVFNRDSFLLENSVQYCFTNFDYLYLMIHILKDPSDPLFDFNIIFKPPFIIVDKDSVEVFEKFCENLNMPIDK